MAGSSWPRKGSYGFAYQPPPQVGYLCIGKIVVQIFVYATSKDDIAFFTYVN